MKHKSELERLTNSIVDYYSKNIGDAFIKNPKYGTINQESGLEKEFIPNPEMTQWFIRRFLNISRISHCEVFLEEPEQNLFPPTQQLLMRKLLGLFEKKKENILFVSGSVVRTATEEDVQDMFEDGVDAFFNIERLGDEA